MYKHFNHNFILGFKCNKAAEYCTRCNEDFSILLKKVKRDGFIYKPMAYNSYGEFVNAFNSCISDEEVIIKNLLE